MSKYFPEFYESILEASKDNGLWGIEIIENDFKQLEINFDTSTITHGRYSSGQFTHR